MNDDELKNTLESIKAKDSLKQKIVRDSFSKKSSPRMNFRKPVLLAVAFLLVIITAIGIPYSKKNPVTGNTQVDYLSLLSVKVYAASGGDASTTNGAELRRGTKILLGGYSPFMSSVPGYPFEFSYPDAEIELKVDSGKLLIWGAETDSKVIGKGQSLTIYNSGKIYWSPLIEKGIINDRTILEFRILEKENIIGVGYIGIAKTQNDSFYSAELLGIIGFPTINGEYQKVSEDTIAYFKATFVK